MLISEVRELRSAVVALGQRVEALSRDFTKVNELTARQQEVDRRTAEAVAEAARAVSAVRQVEKQAVPRTELDERDRAVRAALVAYRKRVFARWTATWVIGLTLMVGGIIFAANWAAGYRGAVYTVCVQRDDQAQKVRAYLEDQRAAALAKAPDQATRDQINRAISQLDAAFPNVDCQGVR